MPELLTLVLVVLAAAVGFVLVVLVVVLLKQNSYLKKSMERIAAEQREIAHRELSVQFAEKVIETRQDAIQKSQAVITGNVTQHIAPFMPSFPYNPKDVHFLGNPVDLVIFDGLTDGELRRIVFVEVKTGRYADLSTRQRQVRDLLWDKKVEWEEFRVNREGDRSEVDVADQVAANVFGIEPLS